MTTSESGIEERHYPVERQGQSRWTGRGGEGQMASAHDERADAFAGWVRQTMPDSYRVAVAILRDEAAAQDVLQDAVLRAWVAWPRLRDRSRLDAWLERIIVNCCRDRLRKEARNSRAIRALRLDSHDPQLNPRIEALRQAMERLSPDHRIAVTLRYFDDLSIEEIARRTGSREGTIKSRLHHALRALRAAYDATERGR
jgi:RNA polymerase sigma-70 factor, ECF subfamily